MVEERDAVEPLPEARAPTQPGLEQRPDSLDVEQPWAEQFESLFRRIAAERGSEYRPGWYVGRRSFDSAGTFTRSMTRALGSAISASATPPGSSSGSGGGGSSGGGGGGGGGGGW